MSCRFAAIALIALCAGSPGARAQEAAPPRDLEPQYIDLLGSWVRPDSGRHTKEHGYAGTFIYGSHVSGPFWVEGRLTGALLETGDDAGTDFYQYGGGIDGVVTLGDRTSWTPFALLGAGAVYDDVQPDRHDSVNFRGDFGLGLVTPAFTDRGLKLRAEGRGLYDTFRTGQLDWQVSLGISIPLGGYREVVVERVPAREVVVERAPAREVVVERATGREIVIERAPAREVVVERAPGERVVERYVERVPAETGPGRAVATDGTVISYDREIVVGPNTRSVTVGRDEVVRFVAADTGRSFIWRFNTTQETSFPLATIAPASTPMTPGVMVNVVGPSRVGRAG